jgi:hypothetical protein
MIKKNEVAKIIIGWAMYSELTIKDSIHSRGKDGDITDEEREWALKNIDRLVYLNDQFDEEMMYF